MIEAFVEPLLHKIEPAAFETVNVDVPQLSATITDGVAGVALGPDVPLPAALVQKPILCVTV